MEQTESSSTMAEEEKLTFDVQSLSDFPSLSAPSAQQLSQAAWGNPTARTSQVFRTHTAAGAGVLPGPSPVHPSLPQAQPQQTGPVAASQFASLAEDARLAGAQNGAGQTPLTVQPKTTSIEDFPPLGRRATTDSGQIRPEDFSRALSLGGNDNNITTTRDGFEQIATQPPGLQGRNEFRADAVGTLDNPAQSRLNAVMVGEAGPGNEGLPNFASRI